jgi:hypothetical protein
MGRTRIRERARLRECELELGPGPSFFHFTTWPTFTLISAGSYPVELPGGMSATFTMAGACAASASGDESPCTAPKLTAKAPTASAAMIDSFALVTADSPRFL